MHRWTEVGCGSPLVDNRGLFPPVRAGGEGSARAARIVGPSPGLGHGFIVQGGRSDARGVPGRGGRPRRTAVRVCVVKTII